MSKAKIAITLEPRTIARVKAEVRARRSPSVSAFISKAVSAQLEEDSMDQLIEEMKQQFGKPSKADQAWARKVLRIKK